MFCFCLCVSAFLPFAASAHEDLLARIAMLTAQMRTNGGGAELVLQRADLYRSHQDWGASLQDYDAAGKALTNSAAVELGQAQALAGWGKFAEARVVFDRLLQRNPTNAVARLGRARALAQLNQPAPAIADYSLALAQLTNPQPEDFLERAALQAKVSGPAGAVKGLDEGLTRLGWTLTLQLAAIDFELARGNPDGALMRLETIITRANRQENWLARKAEILQQAGRTAEAEKNYRAALQAVADLPPRLAGAPNVARLRMRIDNSLAAMKSGGETNRPPTIKP